MARSHYVYVCTINHHPVAAFTVKHELKTWVEREFSKVPTNLRIERLPDGGDKLRKSKDITADIVGL